MKCIDAEKKLDALLDGEIEVTQKRVIENHLKICPSCLTEFKNLRAVSETLRESLMISAPTLLDDKVLSAFKTHHAGKPMEKTPKEKTVRFGIPRFAFTAGLILFALATISAFQLGKMSATATTELPMIEKKTNAVPTMVETTSAVKGNAPESGEQTTVPAINTAIIREKVIRIPVVREKVIVRPAYKNSNAGNVKNGGETVLKNVENQPFTVKSRLRDNQFSTQVNLKGFQVISELKPVIIKGEKNEE